MWKKFISFCQILNRCIQKKIGSFFLPHSVECVLVRHWRAAPIEDASAPISTTQGLGQHSRADNRRPPTLVPNLISQQQVRFRHSCTQSWYGRLLQRRVAVSTIRCQSMLSLVFFPGWMDLDADWLHNTSVSITLSQVVCGLVTCLVYAIQGILRREITTYRGA